LGVVDGGYWVSGRSDCLSLHPETLFLAESN
jgi:hypothetical protein